MKTCINSAGPRPDPTRSRRARRSRLGVAAACSLGLVIAVTTLVASEPVAQASSGVGAPDPGFGPNASNGYDGLSGNPDNGGDGLTAIGIGSGTSNSGEQQGTVAAVAYDDSDSAGAAVITGMSANGHIYSARFDTCLSSACTTPGAPDSSYNPGGSPTGYLDSGLSGSGQAVAVDPSTGDVVVAGYQLSGNVEYPALIRYTSTGTVVSSIGTSLIPNLSSGQFTGVTILSNGDAVAVGQFDFTDVNASWGGYTSGVLGVAVVTSAGALETTFNSSGTSTTSPQGTYEYATTGGDEATSVALDPAGYLIVGGLSFPGGSCSVAQSDAVLLQLSTSGTLNPSTSFGTSGVATFSACPSNALQINSLASAASVSGSPEIIAAGTLSPVSGSPSGVLFGLTSTGAADASAGFSTPYLTPSGSAAIVSGNSVSYLPSVSHPAAIAIGGAGALSTGSYDATVSLYSLLNDTFSASASTSCWAADGPECAAGIVDQSDGNFLLAGGLQGVGVLEDRLGVERLLFNAAAVSGPGTVPISNGSAVFQVQLFGTTVGTVNFATQPGSATAPQDYTAVTAAISFPCQGTEPSAVTCQTTSIANVSVPLQFPAGTSGNLSFTGTVSSGTVGLAISVASATATISYPQATTTAQAPATTTTTQEPAATTTTQAPSAVSSTTTTIPTLVTVTTTASKGSSSKKKKKKKSTTVAAGKGYWVVAANGSVSAFGNAAKDGSVASKSLSGSAVAIASLSSGKGYWVVSSKGGVYAFGSAKSYGSPKSVSGSIVDIVPTPSDAGYWLVSSTGAVYAFGNAKNHGSLAHPSGSVVCIAPSTGGTGYWIATSTGAVNAFGTARSQGSVPRGKLSGAIIGCTAISSGKGYWLVSSKGAVYGFGGAANDGSVSTKSLSGSVRGITSTPGSGGYWMISSNGTIYRFGNAGNFGTPKISGTSAVGLATT